VRRYRNHPRNSLAFYCNSIASPLSIGKVAACWSDKKPTPPHPRETINRIWANLHPRRPIVYIGKTACVARVGRMRLLTQRERMRPVGEMVVGCCALDLRSQVGLSTPMMKQVGMTSCYRDRPDHRLSSTMGGSPMRPPAAPFWPRKNRDCLLTYQLTGTLLTRAPPEKVVSTNNIA
jgi:hypothetical protein